MAKKILLADDSITIQKVVELTFSDGDYEIVAVNNGAKAIQKLQEMRPDIILCDIIMPEKNGYEVCEFVKSHPDLKTIPVILLTGTFEPFDPDRAERAGCDAVVTKPFESQSLIHKVDELVQQSPAAEPPASDAAQPSPFDETHSTHRPEATASSAPAEDEPFADPSQPSPEEIFGATPEEPASEPAAPATDRSGSVFDETNPPGSAPDVSAPFGKPEPAVEPPPEFSAERMATPKMSFDDLQGVQTEAADQPPQEQAAQAQAQEPDPSWSAATTAFPKMSFDDLQKLREEAAPPPPPAAEEPPPEPEPEWPRPPESPKEASPLEGAPEPTRAPAEFGFAAESEEPKVIPFEPPPATASFEGAPQPEPEPPAFSAETTAFPKMTFADLERVRNESAPPAGEELPWTSSAEPLIGGAETEERAPEADSQPSVDTPAFGDAAAFAEAPISTEEAQPERAFAPEAPPLPSADAARSLSNDEVDRIARRVVELMSEKAVRDIAWEVIPDLAQSIVRERIRELEAEGS